MKRLDAILTAEDFVRELENWRRLWRRNAHGKREAGRHAKDIARKRIRRFKRIRGIFRLPEMQTSLGFDERWREAPAQNVKLVLPYRLEDFWQDEDVLLSTGALAVKPDDAQTHRIGFDTKAIATPTQRDARKFLKRVIRSSIEQRSNRHIDLINAAGASGRRLPSPADARSGSKRAVRGIYLEALGAAIIPNLSEQDVEALEANGATVIDNEMISVVNPVEGRSTGAAAQAWHLEKIEVSAARDQKLTGAGVCIGILDTGIDGAHPEFSGKTIEYQAFNTNGSPRRSAIKDFERHGTHVAALCAGNTVGVAPDADLAVAAVLTERNAIGNPCGTVLQIVMGMNWLAGRANANGKGVDVINASIGGKVTDATKYFRTIRNFHDNGILMIAAIGNEGDAGINNHGAPGRFQCVLSVGACDINDNVAGFSAWGSEFEGNRPLDRYKPDLVAPGVNVYSARPNAAYEPDSGTSMACPIVTGAAALLIQQNRALRRSPDGLISGLLRLTRHLPDTPHNADRRRWGGGRLHLADI